MLPPKYINPRDEDEQYDFECELKNDDDRYDDVDESEGE